MSIKRKIKKGRRIKKLKMPPLCVKDKLIYIVCILFGFIYLLVSIFAFSHIQKDIGFSESNVIAVEGSQKYFFMAFWLLFFGIWIIVPFGEKRPIFGDKTIKYGPPKYPAVYPIFMKNKPIGNLSLNQYKTRKLRFAILNFVFAFTFIISAIFVLQSIYKRDVLLKDGSVVVYNERNEEISRFSPNEISKVEIKAQSNGNRGSKASVVYFILTTEDDERFHFKSTNFDGTSVNQLNHIIDLKKIYEKDYIITGTDRIKKSLDRYKHYSNEEKELLKQIFEIE